MSQEVVYWGYICEEGTHLPVFVASGSLTRKLKQIKCPSFIRLCYNKIWVTDMSLILPIFCVQGFVCSSLYKPVDWRKKQNVFKYNIFPRVILYYFFLIFGDLWWFGVKVFNLIFWVKVFC